MMTVEPQQRKEQILDSTLELLRDRLQQCQKSNPKLAQDIGSSILSATLIDPIDIQTNLMILKTILSVGLNPSVKMCKLMIDKFVIEKKKKRSIETVDGDDDDDADLREQQYLQKIIDLLVKMTIASPPP